MNEVCHEKFGCSPGMPGEWDIVTENEKLQEGDIPQFLLRGTFILFPE